MKWSKYIVEESESPEREPVSHLETSRRSNLSKSKSFQLKSCDKAKLTTSIINKKDDSMMDQQNFETSSIKKMISRFSTKGEKGSIDHEGVSNKKTKFKDRDRERETIKSFSEPEEILKLTDIFVQEFHKFLKTFFQTYEYLKIKKNEETALKRKITQNLELSLTKYFNQNPTLVFRNQSPINTPILNSPIQRKASRAIQFKNQKINEKDGFMAPHEAINEVQRLLASNQRQHRFARTAVRVKTKRDRSVDSSIDEILQRSFNDNHKYSKSRLKVQQSLYKFNKVLNTAKV